MGPVARLEQEALAAWVAATCEASGVPMFVSDPVVLRQVATLSAEAGGEGRKRGSAAAPHPRRLHAPGDAHPGRVDGPHSWGAGVDGDVADERSHDGDLSAEVHLRPLTA